MLLEQIMFKPQSAFAAKPVGTSQVAVTVDSNAALEAVFNRNMERLVNSGVDVSELRTKVQSMAVNFNPKDTTALTKLGTNSGERVVQYSDKLLQQVRGSDVDGMGDKLTEVILLAKGINVDSLVNGTKSNIPIIGGLINKFKMGKEKILSQYDNVSNS